MKLKRNILANHGTSQDRQAGTMWSKASRDTYFESSKNLAKSASKAVSSLPGLRLEWDLHCLYLTVKILVRCGSENKQPLAASPLSGRSLWCDVFYSVNLKASHGQSMGAVAMASADTFSVVVHRVPSETPNLIAYERAVQAQKHALVFIGGLTEGPHTNRTLDAIVRKLNGSAFSVWELRMRSSYTGFGYSSLSNDVQDISALVAYLRTLGKEKIVLCGASTGL